MTIARVRRLATVARRTGAVAVLLLSSAGTTGAQMPGMPEQKEMMEWGNTFYILFEALEYSPSGEDRPVNVDVLTWYGDAYDRLWVLLEGEQSTTERSGDAIAHIMYGRLVDPFWDAVVGLRVDQQWGEDDPRRVLLAVGLLGLAPYRFELSPTLYVSQRGELSARLEAAYQLLITQRLIAEPEMELEAALQPVPRFGVSRGLNDFEIGVRFRYEFRREFAPYIGVTRSSRPAVRAGGSSAGADRITENHLVAGFRIWR